MMIRSGQRLARRRHARLAVGRLDQPVGGAAQQMADDLPVELVVLDVEDRLHAVAPRSTRSGIEKKNVEPFPASLSTQIRPPCSSTNFFVMLEPEPGPAELPGDGRRPPAGTPRRCVSSWSAAMPIPVSETRKSSASPWSSDPDLDPALARELQRVAGQVHQALRDALGVAVAERHVRLAPR